jgi:hypothetical protein
LAAPRHWAPVVLVALGLAACRTTPKGGLLTPEEMRERAARAEVHYHLPPGDARFVASEYPELDSEAAFSVYETLASKFKLAALPLEDAPALTTLIERPEPERNKLVAAVTDPERVELADRLRAALGYEFRIRETELLGSVNLAAAGKATTPAVAEAVGLVRARRPGVRFPLLALDSAIELGAADHSLLVNALDRFGKLEIDLGVKEINVSNLDVLAYVASRPADLDALTMLRRALPAFQIAAVTSSGLDTVAAIGSTACYDTLIAVSGTRFGKRLTAVDGRVGHMLSTLASQPGAAALLSILDAGSPDLRFGEESDARALATIAALGSDGAASRTILTALRAGVAVDGLDPDTTNFLVALVTDPALLDVVRGVNATWRHWHASPAELAPLRVLEGAPELAKLGATLHALGLELENGLSVSVATEMAQLAREGAAPIADALRFVFPRLTARDAAALHEIHEIVAARVAPEDILRLDTDSFSGELGPRIRSAIISTVRTRRGG